MNNCLNDKYRVFTTCFEDATAVIKNTSNLKVYERKMISEIVIYLQDLLEYVKLDDIETDYINNWIENCIHVLGLEFEGNFILQFYYINNNYNTSNKDDVIESLISVLVSLRAISTRYPELTNLKPTVFDYLVRDLPKFRKFLSAKFTNDEYSEHPNLFFLLANSIDTFSSLNGSEVFKEEVDHLLNIISDISSNFEVVSSLSPGSEVYFNEIVSRFNLKIDKKEIDENRLRHKPKLFYLLSKLKEGLEVSPDDLGELSSYNHYGYLWWLVKSWVQKNRGDEIIGILPVNRKEIDVDFVFNSLWGDIAQITNVKIKEEDIDKVLSFKDENIKDTLYHYFINHPLVTTYSKLNLEEERTKAHGGGEISDFNVEIELEGKKIWIAIPIKSAAESGSSSSEKMTQNYFYQMVRPILNFQNDNVAVFPIVLAAKTLNTNEFLSLARAHLNLPILLIDNQIYTKILKRYSLLV